jgi:hypothetical protein
MVLRVCSSPKWPSLSGEGFSDREDGDGGGRVGSGKGGGGEEGGTPEGGIVDLPILPHLYFCFV